MFGSKEHTGEDGAALATEIERAASLPVAQLAAEVMMKGFGPDGPGGPGKPGTIEAPSLNAVRVGLAEIGAAFTPAFSSRGATSELQLRLTQLLSEALQLLEHAALVRVSWRGGFENYVATRRGRTALEQNTLEEFLAVV